MVYLRRMILVFAATLVLTGCGILSTAGEESAIALPDDGPPPSISREAAIIFVEKALSAGQRAAETKSLTLVLTQDEVTSFLNIRSQITQELEQVGLDQLDQIEGLESVVPEDINIDVWRSLLGSPEYERGGLRDALKLGLRDPAVYFKGNGQAIFRGHVAVLRRRIPVRFVTAPRTEDGELIFDFVEGQVGKVKMPEFVFDLLGKGLAAALKAGQEYAEITRIRVAQGSIELRGRYNP